MFLYGGASRTRWLEEAPGADHSASDDGVCVDVTHQTQYDMTAVSKLAVLCSPEELTKSDVCQLEVSV
jgi:hypothetical protein